MTTCSMQSAVLAAEERDYVTILDTKQVSAGQCNVVIAVAELLRQHPDWTMEEAVSAAEDLIARAKMCFMPENLEFGGTHGAHQIHCIRIDTFITVQQTYRNRKKVVMTTRAIFGAMPKPSRVPEPVQWRWSESSG